MRAVGRRGQNIYNVAEEDLLSMEQWCREIWRAMGVVGKVVYEELEEIPATTNLRQHWFVDTSKIRTELGYRETVDRNQGLSTATDRLAEQLRMKSPKG